MLGHIFLLLFLMAVNAFFAASEVALISLKQPSIRKLRACGKRGAALGKLSDNTGRFLATVQVGVTLAGFLASAFAADSFSTPLAKFLSQCTGMPFGIANNIAVVLITFLLSFATLIFGELVPKQIGLRFAESFALNAAIPIYCLSIAAAPFVWVLNCTVELVMKPFGKADEEQRVTEEEIRSMIALGEEGGSIETEEKRLIENVFLLNDIPASKVMTHRSSFVALDVNWPPEKIREILFAGNHTLYPVYRGSVDNIIGCLRAQDYFTAAAEHKDLTNIEPYLKKMPFAPMATKIATLLREMREKRLEIAILLDEFGGTAGVVTLHDLLEEIVGELHDNAPEDRIRKREDGIWEADGLTHISRLSERLGIAIPDDRSDTIGGLLLAEFDKVPDPGEHVTIDNVELIALEVRNKRITKVGIRLTE